MKQYLNTPVNLFPAGTALTGAAAAHNVKDSDYAAVEVLTTGFSGTYKFQGSNANTKPNFGAAASATNPWSYISFKEMTALGTTVAGATGITETTQTTVRNFLIDTPCLKWIGVDMTRSAGSVEMNLTTSTQS
jgi:hypothetical protein